MVWITMSLDPHVETRKRENLESKPHSQVNKCLNEKRRREQENIHIEELAELLSASPSDMSSLSCKPDKCAILKETVNQIRSQKQSTESDLSDDLQQSEVSSSKPNIINNNIFGSILLEALEGFLFVVNIEGKVEFVSENITSFLKYRQDDVYEKNIYDFIHPEDKSRFNNNLLLMMPLGNGRDWSSEGDFNSPGKPTKHFNCRFLVKQEKPEIKMENKPPPMPQYENLSITANYIPLGDDGNNDIRNGLTCIARRVNVEEKRIVVNKVEQFTTRIEQEGKVLDIDTSMLSSSSGQYLREELLNANIFDFCHPSDVATLKQHLRDTLEEGVATCVPFKFRVGRDRYARIKTKSKRFLCLPGVEEEFIISTHSIIRDCENTMELSKSSPSPSSFASTSSGPGSVSDSSTSINGSIALSPLTISNSYGNYPTSVSTSNNSELGLGELVLDIFPGSGWTLDPINTQSRESDCTSATSYVSSPQTAPASNISSDTSTAVSPTNSAFVPGLTSSRSGSSAPSPALQSRVPTPFGGSCYSPSASQSSSGKSSPPRALPAKADSLNCSSTESSGNISLSQGMRQQDRQYDMKSNQKLRNLLTQSADDSMLRHSSKQTSQEEVTVLSESHIVDDPPRLTHVNVEGQNIPRTSNNVILRDLLNQDDEDSDAPVEPIDKNVESSVPNPMLSVGSCKVTEGSSSQQRVGSNNMLRQLLNDAIDDRSYRQPQDLIHQLLIAGSGSKTPLLQSDKIKQENAPSPHVAETSVPKQVSVESNRGTPDVTFLSETAALKRKSTEKNPPSAPPKRHNAGHAHLAGQNPMLASMLAQTPRTPPSVPTSVASTIMTQLPQERLPKNLEKKLVHTPYTATSANGISTSSQAFSLSLVTAPMQRDIVTSDSRGHMMQQPSQISVHSGLKTAYSQQQQQQQQGFLDKILSGSDDNILITKSLSLGFSNINPSVQSSTFAQLSQATTENSVTASLADILNDPVLVDVDAIADSVQPNQASDPQDAQILEEICSLREDHNVETRRGADDRAAILKLLGEVSETTEANITARPTTVATTQDINEKIAISAIQKELMEGSSAAIASRSLALQNSTVVSTYSQAGRTGTQVSGTPIVQAQLTSEQVLLLQQQQQLMAGSLPPNYSLVTNRVRLPVTTQASLSSNQELLAQAQRRGLLVRNTYIGIGNANVNQIRKTMKTRLYLQQAQKRALEQKQQLALQTQQPLDVINSPATAASFPENMNDLLNNTVAPNVTLLRSSGIPEVPGSARFNLTLSNPLPSPTNQTSPTPAQLSPGQRYNPRSPFSPLSQQPFPSQTPPPASYQPAQVSPHPPPSYPQGGPSHSPSPIPPSGSPHVVVSPQPTAGSPQWNQRITTSPIQNLQLQNPMLNAQLSQQASIGSTQVRLTSQQRQQLVMRSMSSPAPNQSTRNTAFSSQSDVNYTPLSPVMVLQTQASQQQQQQRVQRARIASGSQSQSNFASSEPVLSPQPLSSPSFSQPGVTTATFVSISSPGGPLTYSVAQGGQQFTFERQNAQVFTSSPGDSIRSSATVQNASELLRQELRSSLAPRNQQVLLSSSSSNQQVLQSLSSGSVTRVLNVQSLSRETLEELGLSIDLLSDGQSTSQSLYSQTLLNIPNSLESSSSQPVVTSPRAQVEEPKPADQKKSLLQQLLSEPT